MLANAAKVIKISFIGGNSVSQPSVGSYKKHRPQANFAGTFNFTRYLYIFNDGTAYVGKYVDMVRRHADHLHEYKHRLDFSDVAISKAYFMTVDDNLGDGALDDLEKKVIQLAEFEGYNLRNLQKTNLPAGKSNFVIDLSESEMRLLPWKRQDRTHNLPLANLQQPASSQSKRFKKLVLLDKSGELLKVTSNYIYETFTEPANTAGVYWSATAFPQGGKAASPCLRITCGTLETLSVWHDDEGYCGFINIKKPEDDDEEIPAFPEEISRHEYSATQNVISVNFISLEHLKDIMTEPRLLDWCYRLNIEMFRHCKNPQAKFTNPLLVEALLEPSR